MDELKEEIETGSYQVDPKAVADAIVLRLTGQVRPLTPSARTPITRRRRR